jgi:RNA ligase (TIGR02306 family)
LRKLASIQRVLNVRPIEGADKIEVVDVLGWSVVVKKGEFKQGDLCVYFEIDSWLDDSNPAFATFEDRFTDWGTKRGMRLKTIRLRKQISQGLVLSLGSFPQLADLHERSFDMRAEEGADVTELLGIEKWEAPEEHQRNGSGQPVGRFPSFIRKTDQERVQNCINDLSKHSDETFEVTIKLDGSSMTVFHVGTDSPYYNVRQDDAALRKKLKSMTWAQCLGYWIKRLFGKVQPEPMVGVCSRNIELAVEDGNHFSKYVRDNGLLDRLAIYGKNIAVQGELIAPSIQQNHENVKDFEFYVFDVFDIDKQEYLLPAAARLVVEELGWKYVPVLELNMKLWSAGDNRQLVDDILKYAEGPGMNQGVKREGIVFKSNGGEFSFKAISNAYLLKKEGKS